MSIRKPRTTHYLTYSNIITAIIITIINKRGEEKDRRRGEKGREESVQHSITYMLVSGARLLE